MGTLGASEGTRMFDGPMAIFDPAQALTHPVTRWCLIAIAAALAVAPVIMLALGPRLSAATRQDIWTRYWTWLVITPLVVVPLTLCKFGSVFILTVVALLAYREFARATGLFRERAMSILVVLGIVTMAFAALDNWYGLFVAVPPLGIAALAMAAVAKDEPQGYLQRVGLSAMALLLFGSALMHLAYFTNSTVFRPVLLMLLIATQASDIGAYCFGKAFGKRKLFPNTSPRKTLAGHIGAFVVAGGLTMFLTHEIYPNTPLDRWEILLFFGALIGVAAQAGDLVLGSIKRDLGLKDLAKFLPGHGGVTDRVNSLLLVAPISIHFVAYFLGDAVDTPRRILTGG